MKILRDLGACPESLAWVEGRDLEQAWNECPRGDWLLWLADRLEVDRKLIVAAACDCAELTLHLCEGGVARAAIEVARAWVRDEATIAQVRKVTYAAYDAAYSAPALAAAHAAWTISNAAHAAETVLTVSSAVGWANAYNVDTRRETLAKCADIVRTYIPWNIVDNSIKRRPSNIRSES